MKYPPKGAPFDEPIDPDGSKLVPDTGTEDISRVLSRYVQAADDQCETGYSQNALEVESLDSGAGTFVVVSTKRWAIESESQIEWLASRLREALKVNVLPTAEDYNEQ